MTNRVDKSRLALMMKAAEDGVALIEESDWWDSLAPLTPRERTVVRLTVKNTRAHKVQA